MKHLLCLFLLTACQHPTVIRDHSPKVDTQRAALVAPKLPPAPPGKMVGDGYGPSARDAVLDARRAVIEQIVAQVSSVTDTSESEDNGTGARHSAVRVRSASHFEHAELLRTLAVEKGPEGFVARVVLDRDDAAQVYRTQIQADAQALAQLGPTLATAIKTLDTSILLSAEHSPGYLLKRQTRSAQIIAALGRKPPSRDTAQALALENKVSGLRQKSVLRLQVHGEGSPRLKQSVVGLVTDAFRARGCRLLLSPAGPSTNAVPVADISLTLKVQNHQEGGLEWRYLGMNLQMKDARSGRVLTHYMGLPQFAHGGGLTVRQAETAVVKRAREVFSTKAKLTFDRINCR